MQQHEFLYRKLCLDIEEKIRGGELRVGEKLPSLRQMQQRLGLSLSTVYQAYMELEAEGFVETRPKSGFFVAGERLVSTLPPRHNQELVVPQAVRLTEITAEVVKASLDPRLIPLGAAVLSPELLPVRHLDRITRDILRSSFAAALPYAPTEGITGLRSLVASRLMGLLPRVDGDNVQITNGCMEAVSLALRVLVREGDVVAVESPTHFGFLHLLHKMNLRVLPLPTDPRFGLLPDSLAGAIEHYPVKACLLIPNFHNPLGALMPDEAKKEIVRLTNERNIPVIEDDVYGELFFDKHRPSLLQQFDEKELVITCSSYSKVLAPGFRIGWCLAGKRMAARLSQAKSAFSLTSPTLQQLILCRFLEAGAYDRYLRTLRTRLKRQVYDTALAVQRYFPEDTRFSLPRGGALLWVELPPGVSGLRVYQKALAAGVSIVPGGVFSVEEGYDRFIRISATSPFTEKVDEGIAGLAEIVNGLMGTM